MLLLKSLISSDILKRDATLLKSGVSQFIQDILYEHNLFRQRHCASALSLDNELMTMAQQQADELADSGEIHSLRKTIEGNYYVSSDNNIYDLKGKNVTDEWYNEIKDYDFKNGDKSTAARHFSRIVWKNSKQLGVGIAYTENSATIYVTALYSPQGNELGKFIDNVSPKRC